MTTNDHLLQEINKHRHELKSNPRTDQTNNNLTTLANINSLRSPSFNAYDAAVAANASNYHHAATVLVNANPAPPFAQGSVEQHKLTSLKKQYEQFNGTNILSSSNNVSNSNLSSANYNRVVSGRYSYSIVK